MLSSEGTHVRLTRGQPAANLPLIKCLQTTDGNPYTSSNQPFLNTRNDIEQKIFE